MADVCAHGHLARKCEVCELVASERENARLRALLKEVWGERFVHRRLLCTRGPCKCGVAALLAKIDAALRGEVES